MKIIVRWLFEFLSNWSYLPFAFRCLVGAEDLNKAQPARCGMADQDPSIFPFHHIVPHRMKLLIADILCWHDNPSMGLHDSTIICLKLCQSWFQGCLLGQSISLAELGNRHLKWLNGIQFVSEPGSTLTSMANILPLYLQVMSVMISVLPSLSVSVQALYFVLLLASFPLPLSNA